MYCLFTYENMFLEIRIFQSQRSTNYKWEIQIKVHYILVHLWRILYWISSIFDLETHIKDLKPG